MAGRKGQNRRKLPLAVDKLKVELSGIMQSGGFNETIEVVNGG